MDKRLRLYGFNNLTKTLSFNIYDVCYAKTEREQKDYIAYIDEQYNSERLTNILCRVTEMIGAQVLSVSKQDYDPQGASVTLLIAEEAAVSPREESGSLPAAMRARRNMWSATATREIPAPLWTALSWKATPLPFLRE